MPIPITHPIGPIIVAPKAYKTTSKTVTPNIAKWVYAWFLLKNYLKIKSSKLSIKLFSIEF